MLKAYSKAISLKKLVGIERGEHYLAGEFATFPTYLRPPTKAMAQDAKINALLRLQIENRAMLKTVLQCQKELIVIASGGTITRSQAHAKIAGMYAVNRRSTIQEIKTFSKSLSVSSNTANSSNSTT